jgi:DNA-binding HxlR family transcriptional regulator
MDALFETVMKFLSSVEGASLTLAVVAEFVFRVIPSQKPLSILYLVAEGVKKLGEVLIKVGQILDKILPQKLK